MRYFITAISFLLLISCNNEINHKAEITPIPISKGENDEEKLKQLIISKGDIDAYKALSIIYLDYAYPEEFIYYALVMANKFNYPQAQYDVFSCLTDTYIGNINTIDEDSANLAISYLLKAYKNGHHQAKSMVNEYDIKYDIKENKKYLIKIFGD